MKMKMKIDLVKLKKDWEKYESAFGEEEYMDIDSHTDMSFKVPQLIAEVEKLQKLLADKSAEKAEAYQEGYKQGRFDKEMDDTRFATN